MFGFKKRRRDRLRAQPFPAAWREILERNVPYYGRLSPAEQRELQGQIQVFVAEKNFEGCGGLVITDEIRVTVAAYACVLLLHRPHDFYPRLRSVLVYPDAYPARTVRPGPANLAMEAMEVRRGESWTSGAVVLSWNNLRHDPSDPGAARNIALHEFAHQLDQENGQVDGAPSLPRTSRYAAWARILGREFESLLRAAVAGQATVIDKYGATGPAEFFAVITESFFEAPHQLQQRHPELYEQLRLFYRQDPAATNPGPASLRGH
ncbi:zinc-dependent peptidase [bacterium]|nr:zinc-dependent peptidase [bacterium]